MKEVQKNYFFKSVCMILALFISICSSVGTVHAAEVSCSTEAGYSYTITRNSSTPDYWVISTPSATRATYAKSTISSRDITGSLNDYKNAVDALNTAEANYKKTYTKAVISAVATLVKLGVDPTNLAAKALMAILPGINVYTVTDAYNAYQTVQNKVTACENAFNNVKETISR